MKLKKTPPYESEKESMMRSRIVTATHPNGKEIDLLPLRMPDGEINYLILSGGQMKLIQNKIFLVYAEYGECDDYRSYNICAFENRESAAAYCASASSELITELVKDDWDRDFDKFNFPDNFVVALHNWYKSDGFPKFEIEEVPWNPEIKEDVKMSKKELWKTVTCENCTYRINFHCRLNPPIIEGESFYQYPKVASPHDYHFACSKWKPVFPGNEKP